MFQSQEFLPAAVIARLTETRIQDPEHPLRVAKVRTRRERIAPAGRLNLIAADDWTVLDRGDHLARILRVMMSNAVDGVVAPMDILEDLLSIDGFVRGKRGAPLLNGKLLIPSLNPHGLVTGPTPAACAPWFFDAIKLQVRIKERDSIVECCHAITQANSLRMPAILEADPATAQVAAIASAVGDSSRYLWLNLPYCDFYETVAKATTLPILVSVDDWRQLSLSMAGGANVRGALLGKSVLHPHDGGDPLAIATAAGRIVHGHWSVDEALAAASVTDHFPDMDRILKCI